MYLKAFATSRSTNVLLLWSAKNRNTRLLATGSIDIDQGGVDFPDSNTLSRAIIALRDWKKEKMDVP